MITGPCKLIPNDMIEKYTMNGQIPILKYYIEEAVMDEQRYNRSLWTPDVVNKFLHLYNIDTIRVGQHEHEMYPGIAKIFMNAFLNHFSKKSNVAVIGSIDPWIESMCLNFGCSSVTTVEYNVPKCSDSRIKVLKYEEFAKKDSPEYDIIVTYSSVEHSGLGRYGDPLNPDGDYETMQTIKRSLKKDGLLFWGAPVGSDALVWNAHRIYGKVRLPYIFKGFEDVNWYGASKNILSSNMKPGDFEQPLIVLKHKE